MAENDGFDRDHLAVTAGTNFSQLLFADDDSSVVGLDVNQSFNFASSSAFSAAEKPPKMLCFGNYQYNEDLVFSDTTRTSQKSGVTCSDSSSTSSSNRLSVNTLSKPNVGVTLFFLLFWVFYTYWKVFFCFFFVFVLING